MNWKRLAVGVLALLTLGAVAVALKVRQYQTAPMDEAVEVEFADDYPTVEDDQ